MQHCLRTLGSFGIFVIVLDHLGSFGIGRHLLGLSEILLGFIGKVQGLLNRLGSFGIV